VLGPSVFIGGVAGAFVGALVQTLAPTLMTESLRASLVPVGMAGVLSASMRVPIASMVMVIEMTGSYGLVVPLMLVTTTAFLVGRRWGLIAEQVETAAESPAHAGDAMIHLLESYLVRDVMERNWPFLASPSTRLSELLARLQSGTRPHFAVLRDERLVGLISVTDILQLAGELHAGDVIVADDIMTKRLITLEPNRTLYEALRTFRENHVDVLPVVANGGRREQPRLLGMLVRDDVFALVRRHMDSLREQVLHEHSALGAIDEDNQLGQLLAGLPSPDIGTIERMPIPPEVHGHSLLEADFRNTYRVEVLAIQTAAGQFICPPDPRRTLQRGDHLLVLTAHTGVQAEAPGEGPRAPAGTSET
jgi:CIC family chloride channel protein